MLGPRCCSAHGCPPGAPIDKSEISELASFFGQFLEQRRRLQPGAQLLVDFADASVDTIQTDRVSIELGPALMCRDAVAVDIDDVDIAGTLGNALFQDLGAFVDQRVHGALDDVFIGQRAALRALFLRGGFQNGRQLRVGQRGARTLLVDVEALAGLLTQHAGSGAVGYGMQGRNPYRTGHAWRRGPWPCRTCAAQQQPARGWHPLPAGTRTRGRTGTPCGCRRNRRIRQPVRRPSSVSCRWPWRWPALRCWSARRAPLPAGA